MILKLLRHCSLLLVFCGFTATSVNAETIAVASVRNDALVEIIKQFRAQRDFSLILNIIVELNKASFLIPVTASTAQSGDNPGHEFAATLDANGARYLPVFTDQAALRAMPELDFDVAVIPAEELWARVSRDAGIHGVAINPAENLFELGPVHVHDMVNKFAGLTSVDAIANFEREYRCKILVMVSACSVSRDPDVPPYLQAGGQASCFVGLDFASDDGNLRSPFEQIINETQYERATYAGEIDAIRNCMRNLDTLRRCELGVIAGDIMESIEHCN